MVGLSGILKAWYRVLSLYLKNPASRKNIKELFSIDRTRAFFEYCGYGIYIGMK